MGNRVVIERFSEALAGKVWREVAYFGPPFDPPAWRAPFVEVEAG